MFSIPKLYTFILICVASLALNANNYVVTNTRDSGDGSLRQAMSSATAAFTGHHNISFNIPLSDEGFDAETGTFTIRLQSELPYLLIAGNITIDATTQTANVGNTNPLGPEIVLDGGDMSLMSCFRIASANNTLKGFCIGGFQYAVLLFGANGGTIRDCYLGTAADGVSPFPNQYGIGLSGGTYGAYSLGYAHNVLIMNNVISGNTAAGIVLEGSGTRENVIAGNKIGTSATGNLPLSNHYGIVVMSNANRNRIGGTSPAERNIISANTEIGIYIESADSNVVCGNYIGPDATGTFAFEYAPDSAIQANGVEINTTGQYNIIGGTTPAERNIISGNRVYGCIYYGNCAHNNICGNYIGTDVSGEMAIPNATGICVDGSSHLNIMENNVLSGNRSYGLFIVTRGTDGNIFRGNLVGTNALGTSALPNDVGLMLAADAKDNLIGGETDTDRNLFSGNRYAGIEVTDAGTEQNRIVGNYIGTDISGNQSLPNGNGIIVSALVKHLDIHRNVISGNTGYGVVLTDGADSNVLCSNHIGAGADSTVALGNGACGLLLAGGASHNRIGGDGNGNYIAHNDSLGIVMMGETTHQNTLSQNLLVGNRYGGIFFWDGCNDGIQPPQITSAIYDSATQLTWIQGTVTVENPQIATVEIFLASPTEENPLPIQLPQAQQFAGTAIPNPDGAWQLVVGGFEPADRFVATVTDDAGNTSEFSNWHDSQVTVNEPQIARFRAWPNPTSDLLHLEIFEENILQNAEIQLFDVNGRKMLAQPLSASSILDISTIAPGLYFIQIIDNQNIIGVGKFIRN